MANINKTYLDESGLQTYDNLIKGTIADVEEQIPAISVDSVNEALVIDFISSEEEESND